MTENPLVFLSYAREDRARVKEIYDSLKAEGVNPWIDVCDIMPGQSWSHMIGSHLHLSDAIDQNAAHIKGLQQDVTALKSDTAAALSTSAKAAQEARSAAGAAQQAAAAAASAAQAAAAEALGKVIAQPGEYLVFFDYNRSDTTPEGTRIIKIAADLVKSQPGSRVKVIGHNDTAENAGLSLERARNVAAKLVALGVPSDRIIYVTGIGDSKPLVPTAKGVRVPENRRVQINILEKGG